MKPKILITNDDGIHHQGIFHLWHALKDNFDLTITAPASEQSGVGLCVSCHTPLSLAKVKWQEGAAAYSVDGTPADCVKLALNYLMIPPPDLIVSGINCGANSGRNVLYSGTVGGVIEGVMHDIPGIAFSCYDFQNPNFQEAEKHILNVVTHVLEHPLPEGTFLNVNFPPTKHGEIKGYKFTRQGKHYWAENPDKRIHPGSEKEYYWIGVKLKDFLEHQDSDVAWLHKGYMTAVPIHVGEMTDHRHLADKKEHFENRFFKKNPIV
jgi:5'/3'-nucleotidase